MLFNSLLRYCWMLSGMMHARLLSANLRPGSGTFCSGTLCGNHFWGFDTRLQVDAIFSSPFLMSSSYAGMIFSYADSQKSCGRPLFTHSSRKKIFPTFLHRSSAYPPCCSHVCKILSTFLPCPCFACIQSYTLCSAASRITSSYNSTQSASSPISSPHDFMKKGLPTTSHKSCAYSHVSRICLPFFPWLSLRFIQSYTVSSSSVAKPNVSRSCSSVYPLVSFFKNAMVAAPQLWLPTRRVWSHSSSSDGTLP